jgi:hypothetical protein
MGKVYVDMGVSLDGYVAGSSGGTGNSLEQGVKLFDELGSAGPALEKVEAVDSRLTTHLTYRVKPRA